MRRAQTKPIGRQKNVPEELGNRAESPQYSACFVLTQAHDVPVTSYNHVLGNKSEGGAGDAQINRLNFRKMLSI